jgi:hypothetical protein
MASNDLIPDASHPYAGAIALASREFHMGEDAVAAGNAGRVRVCARRAVGTFIQEIAAIASLDYGTHAMANLRGIQEDELLPDEIRAAASRLLGGARSIACDNPYSTDPLADARLIIRHFLSKAG